MRDMWNVKINLKTNLSSNRVNLLSEIGEDPIELNSRQRVKYRIIISPSKACFPAMQIMQNKREQ